MANEMTVREGDRVNLPCTIDTSTTEGKMKLLSIAGGNSEAGKDYLPANKPAVLRIADVLIQWKDEYVKDEGEIVPAGYNAVCVLADGHMIHFQSYRVVQYLRACLSMWGNNWHGITLKFTKSTTGGKTNYKVDFVAEGIADD